MRKKWLLNLAIIFIIISTLLAFSTMDVLAKEEHKLLNLSVEDSALVFQISKSGQVSGSVIFNICENRTNVTPQVLILPFTIDQVSTEDKFLAVSKRIDSHHSLLIWFLEPDFKGHGKIEFKIKLREEEDIDPILLRAAHYPKTFEGFFLVKRENQDFTLYFRSCIVELESNTAMAIYQDPILRFNPQKIVFEKPDGAKFYDVETLSVSPIYSSENIRGYKSTDLAQESYITVALRLSLTIGQKIIVKIGAAVIIGILMGITLIFGLNKIKSKPTCLFIGVGVLVGSCLFLILLYYINTDFLIENIQPFLGAIIPLCVIIIYRLFKG
jgi:hypothetical protein